MPQGAKVSLSAFDVMLLVQIRHRHPIAETSAKAVKRLMRLGLVASDGEGLTLTAVSEERSRRENTGGGGDLP
jgi:hypothetical protein